MSAPEPGHCVALLPAAGVGSRFGSDRPKQYSVVGGAPVIVHAIEALLRARWISSVNVVVSATDPFWPDVSRVYGQRWGERVRSLDCGGATRRDTVLAGICALAEAGEAAPHTWVLVHDAARPGLPAESLDALGKALSGEPVGALLALPVADTIKRSDGASPARALVTESRNGLWLAQTPQAFRLELLIRALTAADSVTDEASAVELLGLRPRLVHGSWRNAKLTLGSDLELIAAALDAGRLGTSAPTRTEGS